MPRSIDQIVFHLRDKVHVTYKRMPYNNGYTCQRDYKVGAQICKGILQCKAS